jgi:hypothetical protein
MTPHQEQLAQKRAERNLRDKPEDEVVDPDDLRTTEWLDPTFVNMDWLKRELEKSVLPGYSPRKVVQEIGKDGKPTGRLALSKV